MAYREVTRQSDRYFASYVLLDRVDLQQWRDLIRLGRLQEARDRLKGRTTIEITESEYDNGADGMETRIAVAKRPTSLNPNHTWYLDKSSGGALTVNTASKDLEPDDVLVEPDEGRVWWFDPAFGSVQSYPLSDVQITRDGLNRVTEVKRR